MSSLVGDGERANIAVNMITAIRQKLHIEVPLTRPVARERSRFQTGRGLSLSRLGFSPQESYGELFPHTALGFPSLSPIRISHGRQCRNKSARVPTVVKLFSFFFAKQDDVTVLHLIISA